MEVMGIDYANTEIGNVDVVVGVFDSPLDDSIDYFTSLVGDKSFIKVLNKIDLHNSKHGDFDCLISAKTGEGFDGFKKKIVSFFSEGSDASATFLLRDRHIDLFNESIEELKIRLFILPYSYYFALNKPAKASAGMSTLPILRILFLPSFCFCNSFFLRETSPP